MSPGKEPLIGENFMLNHILFAALGIYGLTGCFQNDQATPAPDQAVSVPGPLEGFDVSHYQGDVDWKAVSGGNSDKGHWYFVMAKAAQGDNTGDAEFKANFAGGKDAGMIRAAYDFYNPGLDPAAQAANFIRRVTLEPGDLPPVVDIETMGKSHEDNSHLVADLHTYLGLLEAHYGVKPIVYTGHAFWNEHMDDSFGEYPLWLAQYGSAPNIPKGWEQWSFWQYSATGSVPGIVGDVDLDRYCCSLKELRALTIPSSHTKK